MGKLIPNKWISGHKRTLIVLAFLLLVSLGNLFTIKGGLVPGEPDERSYANVAGSLHTSPIPKLDGQNVFYSPPLFFYLSYLVSFFTNDYYYPGRFVSVTTTFILATVLYFYLKSKTSFWIAFITTGLFLLLPMTIFYSRLGLLEMLVTFFTFFFLMLFEIGWKKKNNYLLGASGLLLGLGILTKYSPLTLAAVPILVLIKDLVYSRPALNQRYLISTLIPKIKYLSVVFVSTVLVCLPILYWLFNSDPLQFKTHLKYTLGLGGRGFELNTVFDYLYSLPYLFTLPILFFSFYGLLRAIKNWKNNLVMLLAFLLLVFSLVKISLYSPRYLVILIPLVMFFSALGFEGARIWLQKLKINFRVVFLGVVALFITLIPTSITAYRSSIHDLFEEAAIYVKENNPNNDWVFSNYWPSAYVEKIGYKTTWLSNDLPDTQAFNWLTGNNKIGQESARVATSEGALIIVEDLYSKRISYQPKRTEPLDYLQNNYQPELIIKDFSPNWPYFNKNNNQISIYRISR